MSLRINDEAPTSLRRRPRVRSTSTSGSGNQWAILFLTEGFHPGVHHRAGLHGAHQARVRQAPHEDHRLERGLGGRPQEVVQRHRDQGAAPNYPMLGDSGLQVAKLYDMLPASVFGRREGAHPGGTTPRCGRCSSSPGQEDQAHPDVPDDDRAQLSTSCCACWIPSSSRPSTRWRPPRTGSRGRTSSSPDPSATRMRRSSSRRAGKRPSLTCGSPSSRSRRPGLLSGPAGSPLSAVFFRRRGGGVVLDRPRGLGALEPRLIGLQRPALPLPRQGGARLGLRLLPCFPHPVFDRGFASRKMARCSVVDLCQCLAPARASMPG